MDATPCSENDSRGKRTNKMDNLSKREGFVEEGVNQLQIHCKNLILTSVNIAQHKMESVPSPTSGDNCCYELL